jgi:hypothetical protein
MPLISVPAVVDGTTIRLLEAVPFREPYRVMVTFVEPVAAAADAPDQSAFWASFGAWQETPREPTLETLVAERRSRVAHSQKNKAKL